MRSIVIIGALFVLSTVIFVRGVAVKPAVAVDSEETGGIGELVFEYAPYEAEAPIRIDRRHVRRDQPAPEKPAADADADAAASPESVTVPSDAEDRPLPPEPDDAPGPEARVPAEQVVWFGDDLIRLSATESSGDDLRYYWFQLSGPSDLRIDNPLAMETTATGFPAEMPADGDLVYEFELSVTDSQQRADKAVTRFVVRATPRLTFRPAAKRETLMRDGYPLTHFALTRNNPTDYFETIEVASSTRLQFQRVSGSGEYEIAADETDDGYTYYLTVYYEDGAAATFLEFFVTDAHQVPAVVQVTINWQ
jgi:hypothetical protein